MRVRKDTVILDRRFVPKGTIVIKEGELGNQAFLIQSGEFNVYVMNEKKKVALATLGAGQIFGEMALIYDGPRTATVEAKEDSNLIVIGRQQFLDKLDSSDPTIKAVVNMLAERMIDTNNSLINKKADVQTLKEASKVIYQNIAAGLKKSQLRVFQSSVLPKLEALHEALDGFEDRYGDLKDDE